ncbi:MAG: 4-hydroxybenzoate octaprenyltransferase [Candidatus Eisenbacteria bacterium]|uniref:4-hydroxybenzoate octaprenyltransferase n=1 Tax=Eiseniibacteriota bacterium TaxID=2212470 RepID=A0A849SKV3_UNCEI|nr:4-hydroxybenzoate octaprenyltransferase [Candidatus Eisenbacteria bacterium]
MSSASPSANPFERVRTYASFVRFEHTLFSLPLVLAGIFSVAGPALAAARWGWIALAAVGARTAAMAINRIVDRRLDALNPRTRSRELPAGTMKALEAWGLLAASGVAYLIACRALGPWYLRVSWVPLAVFTIYPYLKRFTPLCHFGVGAALALAPLAGFAAAHPDLEMSRTALWLAGFALAWVSGFDIIYATLDEDFDRLHRVRSMVTWLGRDPALRVSVALHGIAFLCLLGVAGSVLASVGDPPAWAFFAVVVLLTLSGVLLWLEQRWAEDVDLAFFKVNVWVGAAVLATVLVARAAGGF